MYAYVCACVYIYELGLCPLKRGGRCVLGVADAAVNVHWANESGCCSGAVVV